jgi:hypothetical protein
MGGLGLLPCKLIPNPIAPPVTITILFLNASATCVISVNSYSCRVTEVLDKRAWAVSEASARLSVKTADSGERGRRLGIVAAGVFAIVAGLGEIIVGFTGNYLGILSKPLEPSAATALVGACYSLGGAFILTLKKWGAALGMAFIAAEILGRIYLMATGVAPRTGPDAIKIAVGAVIALALIGYVASQWRRFR